MTEILDIKRISDNIYNIGCNTFQKDVLYFLWNRFIKNTNDSITDIQAGEEAGCKTIFLKESDSFTKILEIIEFNEKQVQTSK